LGKKTGAHGPEEAATTQKHYTNRRENKNTHYRTQVYVYESLFRNI
jgi:hypothetical protein